MSENKMGIKKINKIKRIIAAVLTVAILINNDYSGFFVVNAQENQDETEATEQVVSSGVSGGDIEEITEELEISGDYTLTENKTVYSLTISSGTLNLNGYALTVLKDVQQSAGALNFNKGALYCYGNFNVSGYGYVYMTNANDYLYVAGDTTWENYSTGYNNLTNGIIEVCGNFTQTSRTSFQPSSYHKVIFSGDKKQIITLNPNGSKFNIIEIQNHSDDGVYSQSAFMYNQMIRNGCRLSIGDVWGEYGFDVSEDAVIEGDFVLAGDTLNLNGHTLTVKGDFIQTGGSVNVNGGKLIVEGDYRIQTRSGEEGAYTYDQSMGILQMQNENDHVLINGSFHTASMASHTGYLTNGVLEVKGDFTQIDTGISDTFVSTENHTLLLSGEAKQTITLNHSDINCPIANLEFANGSEEGVELAAEVCVTGRIKQNDTKVSGTVSVGTDTIFEGNIYTGDVHIPAGKTVDEELTINGNVMSEADLTISGKLTVNGNLTHTGAWKKLEMRGGSLYVSGNLAITYCTYGYGIYMENSEDYVYVGGDFSTDTYYSRALSAGILEVAGDFTADNEFQASGTHKVILSGTEKQTVTMTGASCFATLELQNISEGGVYSAKALSYTTLNRNGCKLQYGDTEGLYGWTLSEDSEIEGDLVLFGDTLDLNGYTLTVRGDFIQAGGCVNVNGGSLIVEGDYRIQTRNGETGAYTYDQSTGILQMQKENDTVLVKGSFYTASKTNHTGYLTNGVLEVKGDFTQVNTGVSYAFVSTENHKLLLSGETGQTITFKNSGISCQVANLELSNGSEAGVVFGTNVYVTGKLSQKAVKVSGSVKIGTGTSFEGNSYSGDVYLIGNRIITEELTINGDMELAANLTISGKLNVNGNLSKVSPSCRIEMKNGSLYVSGDLSIKYYRNGYGLYMENSKDSVYVGGDFLSECDYLQRFSAGTLEVAGDFTVNNLFQASGSHRVILSGTGKQTVTMTSGACFAALELQNYSEEGVYSAKGLSYTTLVRNGCKLQYGDTEGVFGWTLTEDTVMEGDLVLFGDTLDLSGYTLTVKGDFIQAGGCVSVNGGNLIVEGDYRIQTRNGGAGAYTYDQSSGILQMQNENDSVLVMGSFYTASVVNHTGYLTDGILEVKGDFTKVGGGIAEAFVSTGNHKILLSGENGQTVAFNNSSLKPVVANLELMNGSKEGVAFGYGVYVTGRMKQNATKLSGTVYVGAGTTFEGNTYTGDVNIVEGKTISEELIINGNVTASASITLPGKLTVNGNLSKTSSGSRIELQSGSLYVSGDLTIKYFNYGYGLYMENSEDYVYVGGDFHAESYYVPALSAGTLEVAGDFTVNNAFQATGSHRVILSGTKKQSVTMSDGSCFVTLELRNHSEEGVYSAKGLNYTTLVRNGCKLQYGDTDGVYGWTLSEDYVTEGDLVLLEDTLDLNGCTLTITGDFIHMGGEVKVNGGKLTVQGDYRQQIRTGNEGAYTYAPGRGRLTMNTAEDVIHVKGDFVLQSGRDAGECFTAGELRIDGDFTQLGNYPFESGGTHLLIFSGEEAQTISAAKGMAVANITIDNTGSKSVRLNAAITASGKVTDKHGHITGSGTVAVTNPNQLVNNSFSGNLILTGNNTLSADLRVGGTLTAKGKLDVNGYSVNANAITVSSDFYLRNGTVSCNDGFNVDSTGCLIMQDAMGYLLVGGNFSISSKYSHKGYLTDGVLEVRGDFTQSYTNNFIATGNHTTILSRKRSTTGRAYIQTISFSHPGTAKFHKLVLKKPLSEYQFKNNTGDICNELIYDIEDSTAPTEVAEIYASSRGVTDITIAYPAAEDESGVAGYEIYRNDVKIAVTSNLSYRDCGLQPDTEYTYSVYAYDNYRNIALTSPKLTVKTMEDTEAPSAPACPNVVTRTGSAIRISWNEPSDNVKTTGYNVYRNDELIAEHLTASTYRDGGLEKNLIYRYSVEAVDASGNVSERSETVSSTVAAPVITEVSPADYSSIGGDKVTLSVRFKNVGNSTGNKVKIEYRADEEEWQLITPTLLGQKTYNSTTLYVSYAWDISKLTGDKEYAVRYTLYDADDNTDVREVSYLIDKEAPEPVKELAATADNGAVRLTWEVSTSADCVKYKVYRKSDADSDFDLITTIDGKNEFYYTDKDVQEGSTYTYAVTAVDDYANESRLSEEVTVTVDADESAPVVKKILPSSGKINATTVITATATDNRNVSRIKFFCKKDGEVQWNELATVEAADGQASYSFDTTAYADGIYHINAVAVDESGNESEEEFTRRYIIDNTGISKINITNAESGITSVRLHWEDVTDGDFGYFQVEQKEGDAYKKVGETADTLGFTVENLAPETTYTFIVVGYDSLGNRGEASDEFVITTVADTTGPQIKAVYPVSSYYKDIIRLQMRVEDNYAVGSAVFSYSTDGSNFVEIAKAEASSEVSDCSLSQDFDISALPEGSVFVKFEAYDKAGNKNLLSQSGEEIVVEYFIDRTAPAKVENVKAVDGAGYVELTWNKPADEDTDHYRIYRAGSEDGIFKVVAENCTTLNYYDTQVAVGSSYIYKLEAVDIAGNVGEISDETAATVSADETAPMITGMSPYNGERVGANPVVKALAMDNALLSSVRIEYMPVDSADGIWSLIGSTQTSERSCLASFTWNTEGLEEGIYRMRSVATDRYGNVSEAFEVTYTLDLAAPAAPTVSVTNGHFEIGLVIEHDKCDDFAHYEIQRRAVEESDWKEIAQTKEQSYTDTKVAVDTVYLYRVAAYDKYGNYSVSEEVQGYADDVDVVAPVASVPENMVGLVGMELAFDGMGSTDNVRITQYRWDMGNGDTIYGAQPRYTYAEAGTYQVKLTVSDAAGNTAGETINVRIDDKTGRGVAKVRVVGESGHPVPYAYVYMELAEGNHLSLRADSEGYVTVAEKVGLYRIAAYGDGYLPEETEIVLNEYETKEYALTLVEDELIVGDLTVHKMTLEEMVEKGVDFSDPDNYHTFVFRLTLGFREEPIPTVIQYICNGGTGFGGGGGAGEYEPGTTPPGHKFKIKPIKQETDPTEEAEWVPVLTYLTIGQSIFWLKEMYEVELGILNAADSQFVIEDSSATLNLPESGVSLAGTMNGQTLTQSMGSIAGQERKSASWIVRGAERGTYSLSADFEGRLMPFDARVSAHFETKEEISVSAGEGLHIYVMPESTAYIGEKYYIQFELRNESDHPFYGVSTSFGPQITPTHKYVIKNLDTDKVETIQADVLEICNPTSLSQSVVMTESGKVKIPTLNPGETFRGTYVTTFSAQTEADPDDVYYKLVEAFVENLQEENLGVEVSILPIPGHITKYKIKSVPIPTLFGDPVDATSGYFEEELTPLCVTGATPLTFDLNYSSGITDTAGQMGYGWYHDYEVYLEEEQGIIRFHLNPNAGISFIKEAMYASQSGETLLLASGEEYSHGEYICLNAEYRDYRLNKNTDGTYTITMPNGGRYEFDAQGRMTAIFDSEGKNLTLSYHDGVTVLTETVSGKRIYLNDNGLGQVGSVSDDAGRQTTFTYDAAGNLSTLTDPEGHTLTYSYDENHRILTEGNEQGIYVSNVYDGEGRVVRQTDALNNVITTQYQETDEGVTITITDAGGNVNTAYVDHGNRLTKVADDKGRFTEYDYDAMGNLVCERDAYGKAVYKEYDSRGNLVKITDKGGQVTSIAYDNRGNVSTITNGKGNTAGNTYYGSNLTASTTDYNGLTTSYEYNENRQVIRQTTEGIGSVVYTYTDGLVSSVTDYMGNTTTSKYDVAGNLIEQTDPCGNKTTFEYDRLARITKKTDAAGKSHTYSYDCNGKVTSETDALGNVYSYEYDRAGNKIRQINPDGTGIDYQYDSNGNCTKVSFADGTSNSYTYDGNGNLLKEVLADGTEMSYGYDLLNMRISETDKDGRKVSYEYYPNGNLYKTTYPDGTYELNTYDQRWKVVSVSNQSGHTVSYEHDNMGNVTMERDPLGNAVHYEYDSLGRLIKETDPEGNSTTYEYDANSNCIKKTNAAGVSVHMTYDALNRMTSAYMVDKDGEEYRVSYTYDAIGRVTSSTDEEGYTTHMSYDAAGNLISLTDAKGTVIGVTTYDSMGRATSVKDALGVTTEYSYDIMGNLIQATQLLNGRSAVTSYSYDTLGRMTSVKDAREGVTSVTYDGRGNTATLTDANGGTTRYSYDDMNRLIAEVSPMGSRTAYSYNAEGLLADVENARGQKTDYTYDASGRITSMTDELGTVDYSYDANGNVLTVEDGNGTITRKYDSLNRVTEYTDYKGNTVKYAYDEIGNLVALTYPGGEIVRYTYYKNSWLKSVTDTKGLVTSYEYDPNGSMTRCVRPNGTEEICVYNAAGLLTEQRDVKTSGDGTEAGETVNAEDVITAFVYTYDERGNITAINSSETTDITEGTSIKNAEMTYDADNRLISYNGEEIRYDADGNMTCGPVNGIMSELTYDCRNRLVSAGGVRYTYDAENNRISAETDEYIEEYVVDTVSASLSRVLVTSRTMKRATTTGTDVPAQADTTSQADVTVCIYGNGLISEYQGDLALFHHYNNLGSTMKLTDASGNVAAVYSYGAYGELLSGDTSFTRFLYNGRCGVMTDDNGLYYMRQRYYNTEIKRFINQDVIRGNLSNSQSLNRYSYVQGNPISYTDPFGLSPLSGLFSGTGIIHAVLGLLGCVPGPVGIIANVVDAVVYAFVDHDYGMAFLAALSAVTLGAANVAKAAKAGSTLAKTANAIGSVAGVVTNLTNFALCAKVATDTIGVMYEKYVVQGQSFDKSTLGEIITLGTAFFGCIVSGKGLANETKQLSKMMQETQEASVLTGSFTENAPDIKVSEGKYAPAEDCRISIAASSGQNAVGFEIQYKSHNGASSGGITVSKTNNTKSSSKGGGEVKKPYATSRPSYGKGQVEQVWENAKDPITGKVYDPSGVEITWDPTKPRNGQWDMGHIPGEKYSEMHQLYMDDVITKDEFLEWYRNPDNYRPELPSTNRSHKYE